MIADLLGKKRTKNTVKSYEKWLNKKEIENGILRKNLAITKANKYTETINVDTNNPYSLLGVKKGKEMSIYKADKGNANPLYVLKTDEYTLNCQRCVWAYEARRRGYDVIASEKILNGVDTLPKMKDPKGWANVVKDGLNNLISMQATTEKGCKSNIEAKMKDYGDGSRAIIRVQWQQNGGGHVFIAEHVNGKTKFIDPQSGSTDIEWYFDKGMIKPKKTYLLRTDDKEFSDLITKCIKGRKK